MTKSLDCSISENNGLALLSEKDHCVYSVGISTGGAAEMRMAMAHLLRRIIATTIDPEGALYAKKRIEHAGLERQIEIKMEDVAQILPYPETYFDFIYARLVLHYLPKVALVNALGELYRVLKPNGKLFVVVRSEECQEVKGQNVQFDPETHMTTYASHGRLISRYFHSERSIANHLRSAGCVIEHVKSYEEQLCVDFQRLQPASQVDTLIEVLASK